MSQRYAHYVSILEASFDAGLLVGDDKSGSILHMNYQAKGLFGIPPESTHASYFLREWIIFWCKSNDSDDNGEEKRPSAESLRWSKVRELASQPDHPVQEFAISYKNANPEEADFFPASLKLSRVLDPDTNNKVWMIYLRENGGKKDTANSITPTAGNRAAKRALDMLEAALDPVFQINEKGIILMVNQAAMDCFQYESRDELVGHNISMICGGKHGRKHDNYLQKYLQTGETAVIGKYRELPARRADGSEFLIRLAVVELETDEGKERLFCGYVHDVTQERRNEDIIFGTIDTSLDPVFHVNEKGIIKNINMAAVEHLGWDFEELLGQNVSIVVGGGHAAKHDKYIQRYLETGETKAIGKRRRLLARRKDGSELPIELQLSEIKLHGGQERLFCAILALVPEWPQH